MNKEAALKSIEELLGARASTADVRRVAYSHDMGTLPDMVKKFIKTTPDLVVQPESEEEIEQIATIAAKAQLPLVPRGSASSGYGGAMPASGGVVVDMYRMRGPVSVDANAMTATADAASVMEDLDLELREQGFMMPIMPTSSPSATIGGFVCQGGCGIGSCRQKTMRDSLVAVRIVLGDGTARTLAGEDLDLVYGMEGITGIVTSVTWRILPAANMEYAAFGFENAAAAQAFAHEAASAGVWHESIQPPNYVALKNRAIGSSVPEKWMVFVASEKIELDDAVVRFGAERYSFDLSKAEWDERYYPLRGKKFGPSIIPVDVLVPQDMIARFDSVMVDKFEGSFVYEATAVGQEAFALIGFILADERKDDFAMSFANSLVISEAAKKLGGRAYASGMYLTTESESIFGKDRLNAVAAFKAATDPSSIMNPGKVLPVSMDAKSPAKFIARAIGSARSVAGIGAALGRVLGGKKNEAKKLTDLPNNMEDSAFSCAACGFCRGKCTVFLPDPWEDNSPRGKWYLIKEYAKGNIPFDLPMVHKLNICTTCKRCEQTCEVSLKMADEFLGAKPYFKEHGFSNAGLSALRENVLNTGNFWGVEEEGVGWHTDDMRFKNAGEIGLWPGCWTQTISKNAAQNVAHLLNAAGIEPVDLGDNGSDICCGFYLFLGGYADDFEVRAIENIKRMNEAGVKKVLAPCPACLATFAELYGGIAEKHGLPFDIEFVHSIVMLNQLVENGALRLSDGEPIEAKVTYHDPCHLGRWFNVYEEPRSFIQAVPGVDYEDMRHNRQDSLCCGLVNAFYEIGSVPISGTSRVAEADEVQADYILTACAGCGVQVNNMCVAANVHARQMDITDLAAKSLGYEVHDSNEAAHAYFAAAVDLLSTSTTVQD
ncbi:FAD-binding oxidoreductase [Paraeggerthella hongkongensis]|uniref:FAD-binding and (Fe-S)-binding domain-containing protein n=1 Tax=Paraeggerthella hominis TaxID=2897351 RepID=UPI001C10B9AB|nr:MULTISPECIES: FAD-binding and (Fe-S)-binding domain-containing protein [Paraeggerthella]MBU5405945.1 FAD-binding oxidoreductase [Paraeggerthella hongkongensis]MCD2433793.1 FAD-binding oxidoreductase [Paraeggerthella hominis]